MKQRALAQDKREVTPGVGGGVGGSRSVLVACGSHPAHASNRLPGLTSVCSLCCRLQRRLRKMIIQILIYIRILTKARQLYLF